MELQDWRKEPRKNYSNEFKLRMVELASQPGACVATRVSASSCKVEFRHGNMTLENPSPELLTVLIRELTGRGR
ncbi:hypothetical protein HVX11_18255 [Escherichia coli]|uniref:hypothetical protein n=1 Tax=Escherichia coli TaxID=562 RepID=UPI000BE9F8A3|nr:hypothetical protein [Escherichia coli]MBA8246762.1 hypothetical protein [Escherichia coli]MBA8367026.1 hypothetical protein [Escherichia coli]MED9134164.1 hypothetical protein [Escherichia coli]QMO25605.1 hypothetical protein HVW48_04235 [Escherichia coli]QMO35016.1 hypothetical protein HVW45_04235 [Escherichia coli]